MAAMIRSAPRGTQTSDAHTAARPPALVPSACAHLAAPALAPRSAGVTCGALLTPYMRVGADDHASHTLFDLSYDGTVCTTGQSAEVRFRYHVQLTSTGALRLRDAHGVERWSVSTDQGTAWLEATVSLPTAGFTFEGQHGSGFSEVALDDVSVTCRAMPPSPPPPGPAHPPPGGGAQGQVCFDVLLRTTTFGGCPARARGSLWQRSYRLLLLAPGNDWKHLDLGPPPKKLLVRNGNE